MAERRVIQTDYLARVEGEGAMTVRLHDGVVEHVELRIFEPPRFFEALLRGRSFAEAPDITARICGICPVAYQTSAVNALENLCGVEVPDPIRQLRRLLYCGEWIESHALHVYMLHAPDFLGYAGAVELARDAPQAVERGLALKRTGNELMTLVGGREIHPINVRVGGFYRAPSRRELQSLVEPLERAREAALETVRWTAGFDFPERTVECELVALSQPEEYAIERGRICSDAGLDISPASTTSTSRRSMSSARPLCTRDCESVAPTCAARSRAFRSTTTSFRPSRWKRPVRRGWSRRAAIPSAASSSAVSNWSTPATRRCA